MEAPDRYYLRNPEKLGGADRGFQADWGLKHDESDIEYIRADLALSERHQRLVYLAALAEDYLHHIPLDGKGLGIAIALKEELENLDIDLKAALEGEASDGD